MKELDQPKGFQCVAAHIGIKESKPDFALIYSEVPCTAAAVFTRNTFCGPSVTVGRERIANGRLQAVVVTSGNANVATGETGLANVREIGSAVARALRIEDDDVLVCATGVIGRQLPMTVIRPFLEGGLAERLRPHAFDAAAEAILTTDLAPKIRSVRVGGATLLGMVKGAGMIEPNMATMLAYFATDASIDKADLDALFRRAIDRSLNMISVDTDTSTSDTAVILANGAAGAVDLGEFERALTSLAIELGKDIVRSGEGASKLIEVTVESARSFEQAKKLAKSIVNSPLVKTAVHGADPNWGRVAMALGKTLDPDVDPERIAIWFGPIQVYDGHDLGPEVAGKVKPHLEQREVSIRAVLGVGNARATVWGCDLTDDYIDINANYTT